MDITTKTKTTDTKTAEKDDAETYLADLDALADAAAEPPYMLLDDVRTWFARFIRTQKPADLDVLALWTLHTMLLKVLPISPRLILDSIMPGSGKTTVLEHIEQLGHEATMATAITGAALLPRMIAASGEDSLTLLIDEADRTLDPAKEGVGDLIATVNSGYKHGGSRPVLVPDKDKGWKAENMPTYAAVAMAGNSPRLADDTRSRAIPIFLLPDWDGSAEETDWVSDDTLTDAAAALHARMATWAQLHAEQVQAAKPSMPARCRNRNKERWISFAKIAAVSGGDWPAKVDALIKADLDRLEAEKADGIEAMPPKAQLIRDLLAIMGERDFMETTALVAALTQYAPETWGIESPYGKAMTRQRLSKMLAPMGIHSTQGYANGHKLPRGYKRLEIAKIAETLHIPTDASHTPL